MLDDSNYVLVNVNSHGLWYDLNSQLKVKFVIMPLIGIEVISD